ncbi:MAG: hypothetical protein N4A33_12255 [Bacteriovoracaceae bacterium]|jgi:hypothetical protein|nr:hypothetical protein [Bacteriovoracaceae bacterium]
MYWFGKKIDIVRDADICITSQQIIEASAFTLDQIFNEIDILKQCLLSEKTKEDIKTILSKYEFELFYTSLIGLVDTKALRQKLEFELDARFTNDYRTNNELYIVPKGVVYHVTSSNIFLGALDSLLMGIITKNINIVKVSNAHKDIAILFYKILQKNCKILTSLTSFVSFKSGNKKIEELLVGMSDLTVVWGSKAAVEGYQKYACLGHNVIGFGPKISFGVIEAEYCQNDLEGIVKDVTTWNQLACSNMQCLFISDKIDYESFMSDLNNTFEQSNIEQDISSDVQVLRLEQRDRVLISSLKTGVKSYFKPKYILEFIGQRDLESTILYNSLKVATYKDEKDLFSKVFNFKKYLQTCGIKSNNKKMLQVLKTAGVKRFTTLGHMTQANFGTAHDGKFVLSSFVDFINDERGFDFNYKKMLLKSSIKNIKYPIGSKDLNNLNPLDNNFISKNINSGMYFCSGGTTSKYKYSSYSYNDFNKVSYKLALSYIELGLTKADLCANLFVAGNMWSSFIAIQKAIEFTNASQLPIGGNSSISHIVDLLCTFKPSVLFVMPSTLIRIYEYVKEHSIELTFETIFYAAEIFSKEQRKLIKSEFGVKKIYSAGYAGVDFGIIGYQDKTCQQDEHILFNDVNMQIVEGQAIVTSTIRENMPIIEYETGDRIEFIGNEKRKFKLLGRFYCVKSILEARIDLNNIFSCLEKQSLSKDDVRLEFTLDEKLKLVVFEATQLSLDIFIEDLYEMSKDLSQSLSLDEFTKRVYVEQGTPVYTRTGKVQSVIDHRI